MNTVVVKKNIGITIIFLIAFGIVYVLWRIFFYGSAIIVVSGDIDQTLVRVSTGEDKLFPSGSEGREYILQSSTGSKDIQISGPLIDDQNFSINVESLGVSKTSTEIIQISPQQIGGQLVDLKNNEIIDSVRAYGEKSDWLLVSVDQNTRFAGNRFFIYRYITDWNLIDSGVKVDAFSEKYANAPVDLVSFLKTNAGD